MYSKVCHASEKWSALGSLFRGIWKAVRRQYNSSSLHFFPPVYGAPTHHDCVCCLQLWGRLWCFPICVNKLPSAVTIASLNKPLKCPHSGRSIYVTLYDIYILGIFFSPIRKYLKILYKTQDKIRKAWFTYIRGAGYAANSMRFPHRIEIAQRSYKLQGGSQC